MPFSDLFRGPPCPVKLVDVIPVDCGSRKRRRRPTVGTEETHRCSDDELSELVVVAVTDDSENHDCSVVHIDDDIAGTPCTTPLLTEPDDDDEMMVLSVEELLRKSRSTDLVALLEENQRALENLFASQQDESRAPLLQSTLTSTEAWKDAPQFELQRSLPGVAAMLLYCVAHASMNELISNLAYEFVDRALSDVVAPWCLYTALLLLGCLLARGSGLVWNFIGPLEYKRVKWVYHNRIRLGAVDARCLHWLLQQGDNAIGMVNMFAFYLCYIAVFFFVGQLAMYCDQKETLLDKLPSALYQEKLKEMMDGASDAILFCPAQDYSPQSLFELSNLTATPWDPMACVGANMPEILGPEDELFLTETLSRNSFDSFLGQEYEVPVFDSIHQVLFYTTVLGAAVVTMKVGFGFSFGSGW